MIDKSGGKIKFTVKAFKEITHGGDTRQNKTCFYIILYIIFFCIYHTLSIIATLSAIFPPPYTDFQRYLTNI